MAENKITKEIRKNAYKQSFVVNDEGQLVKPLEFKSGENIQTVYLRAGKIAGKQIDVKNKAFKNQLNSFKKNLVGDLIMAQMQGTILAIPKDNNPKETIEVTALAYFSNLGIEVDEMPERLQTFLSLVKKSANPLPIPADPPEMVKAPVVAEDLLEMLN